MSKNLSTLLRNGNNTNPLPVSLGGTGATTAQNALTLLGALSLTGGTMTGNIVFNNGQVFAGTVDTSTFENNYILSLMGAI